MQAIFVPKYKIYYRVSPKEPNVLQWSNKPFGPATQWQTAMRFGKPIRALDTDDKTGQGVVVLNDSSTYVGSGVRVWGRKFYPAGTRIYSLYAIGESKMKHKLKIKIHEKINTNDTDIQYYKDVYKILTRKFKDERVIFNYPFILIDGGRFPDGKKILGDSGYYANLRLKENPRTILLQCSGGSSIRSKSYIDNFSIDKTPNQTANEIADKINEHLPQIWQSFEDNYTKAIKRMFGGLYSHFYDKYLDVIEDLKKEYLSPKLIRAEIDKLIDRDSD